MVGITFVAHDRSSHPIDAEPGTTLMEAAYWNGVPGMLADCGGDGGCATCQILIGDRWQQAAGPCTSRERSTLRFAFRPTGESRLACYIRVTEAMDGMTVRLPDRQF